MFYCLPSRCRKNTQSAIPPPVVKKCLNGRGKTVLIMDDEPAPAVLELLSLQVKGMNAEFIAVNNGAAAQERMPEEPNDICVIITDVHMPSMSGLPLSKNPRNQEIMVPIILSGEGVEPDIAGAFKHLEADTKTL